MPMRVSIFYILVILFLGACSTQRKISKVGLRDPSSVVESEGNEISALRAMFSVKQDFNARCPMELQWGLRNLALQKVIVAPCPADFLDAFALSRDLLESKERDLLDSVSNNHCAAIAKDQTEESLRNFLGSYDSVGPIGRISQAKSADPQDKENLEKLLLGLRRIVAMNLPLEKWEIINGEYLLTEGDLRFLEEVTVKRGCILDDYRFDNIQESIHSMEELLALLEDPQQAGSLRGLLQGLHKLVDTKVSGYFKR